MDVNIYAFMNVCVFVYMYTKIVRKSAQQAAKQHALLERTEN